MGSLYFTVVLAFRVIKFPVVGTSFPHPSVSYQLLFQSSVSIMSRVLSPPDGFWYVVNWGSNDSSIVTDV